MNDIVQSGGDGARMGSAPRLRQPLPELPENVAVAGTKPGRQYLYRPGELLVSTRDLERDGNELLRLLEEEYGAVVVDVPPSRMSCRDPALALLERDPGCPAVRNAYDALRIPSDDDADPRDVLRERVEASFERLRARDAARREQERATLARNCTTMLILPTAGVAVPKVLKELRRTRDPAVTNVSANQVFGTLQDLFWVPSIPAVRLEPGALPETLEGSAGAGVRVAVVDTGIRPRHAWLKDKAEARGEIDFEELDEDRDMVLDFEAGHGTFVAGVIRQHAPGATVVARAAVDTKGMTDDLRLAAALETLEGECIDILNLSVGGPADANKPAPMTRQAIDTLRHENPRLTVVAGAGNRNRNIPFYPAAFPDVIAVGALDRSLQRAAFSNYGPWVDTWALGVDIESSYVGQDLTASLASDTDESTDGARWSGTSFAAPRVAGAIAAAMAPER